MNTVPLCALCICRVNAACKQPSVGKHRLPDKLEKFSYSCRTTGANATKIHSSTFFRLNKKAKAYFLDTYDGYIPQGLEVDTLNFKENDPYPSIFHV